MTWRDNWKVINVIVLVIPDVHLKPWMFQRASERIKEMKLDRAVCLMDIADDWGQELNLNLYGQTYDAAIAFAKEPRGLIINGYQDIQISGLLGLYVTFRFFYQGYIGCQDGMVKVYVPKVTKVESTSDNPTKYKSFERFLKSWRICNDDGSPRVDKDGLVAKDIDRMEQTFNLILFAPLYYMLQARQRPLKVDEEEW